VALAEQELNNQFKTHGWNKVSFLPGYIANVYSGSSTWPSSDTPSNHSLFSFAKVEPIRAAEQKTRHLTLQLILTQGRGMSVKEIKASNKQEVHPPMSFHELQEQLLMFTATTDIIFGELSFGSQCLKALSNMMIRHKSIFKAKERLDEEFPAKFLLGVNTRFQIWLNDCKSAKNRDEVDDSIINFQPLVNQVIFGSFHMILPPTFSMKSPNDTTVTGPGGGGKCREADKDKHGNKKKGKGNDEAHLLVKNVFPRGKICMLTNETWAGNFAGKNANQRCWAK
jgi:hypothetical protein